MATENNCACADCKHNREQMCTSPAIELSFSENGETCECKTYESIEQQFGSQPPSLGLGAPKGF
jgi:hypothetical protein